MYSHLGRITLRRAVSYVKKKEETQVVGGGNNRMNDLKDCYFSSALISQYHFSLLSYKKV